MEMPWKMFEPHSRSVGRFCCYTAAAMCIHIRIYSQQFIFETNTQLNESVQKSVEMNGGVHTKLEINCTELEK